MSEIQTSRHVSYSACRQDSGNWGFDPLELGQASSSFASEWDALLAAVMKAVGGKPSNKGTAGSTL